MKKQGSVTLRLGLGVLGMCLLLQALNWLFRSEGPVTQPATFCEAGDGISVTGFVVREEQVLPSLGPNGFYAQEEGQWVGAGQQVACAFATKEQLACQLKRQELEQQIQGLRAALRCSTGREISSDLISMSQSLAAGVLPQTESLKGRILCREDLPAAERRLNQLEQELSALPVSAPSQTITAPAAGCFVPQTDGWEDQLTPEALQALPTLHPAEPVPSAGKLVTSNTWYFVATVDAKDVEFCRTGQWITVRFAQGPTGPVSMRIERIAQEGTDRVVILQCDEYLSQVLTLRTVSAELIFQRLKGLKIPKKSLYCNKDGQVGVYVLEGAQAVWKQVALIKDLGSDYLVELDQSSLGNLWPDDRLILTDDMLYDRKVVYP